MRNNLERSLAIRVVKADEDSALPPTRKLGRTGSLSGQRGAKRMNPPFAPLGPKYHPAWRLSYHFGCHVVHLPRKLKRNLGRHAEGSAVAILGRCFSHILRRRIFT